MFYLTTARLWGCINNYFIYFQLNLDPLPHCDNLKTLLTQLGSELVNYIFREKCARKVARGDAAVRGPSGLGREILRSVKS